MSDTPINALPKKWRDEAKEQREQAELMSDIHGTLFTDPTPTVEGLASELEASLNSLQTHAKLLNEQFVVDAIIAMKQLGARGFAIYGVKPSQLCKAADVLMKAANLIEGMMTKQGWQPIDTAPTDGTEIIAYHPAFDTQFFVRWVQPEGQAGCWYEDFAMKSLSGFTHWHPLLKPPTTE